MDENERVPMVVVATAGGGIRAAYWTAVVLEKPSRSFWPTALHASAIRPRGMRQPAASSASWRMVLVFWCDILGLAVNQDRAFFDPLFGR
jgi:hypothetical protein